jgi:hypothetical protein
MNAFAILLLLLSTQPQPVALPVCRPVRMPESRMISHVHCVDSRNGISFRIPSNWKAHPTAGEGRYLWFLSFTGSDSAERTGLTLIRQSFDQSAADLGFSRDDSGWHVQGLIASPASSREGTTWRGLQGETIEKCGEPADVCGTIDVVRAFAASTDRNLTLQVEPADIRTLAFLLEHLTFLPEPAP